MGVASGCGEQEVGVASGSGWNLWVWLLGVVVRRYIDFLILLIPTPLVSVLFYSSILLLYLFFFTAASLLFVHLKKIFFVLYIYVLRLLGISHSIKRITHSIERTAHSIERTAHSIERTMHSIERTVHSIERTTHSIERTVHSIERTAHSIERNAHSMNLQKAGNYIERCTFYRKRSACAEGTRIQGTFYRTHCAGMSI